MPNGITHESFDKLDTDGKLAVLFDIMAGNRENADGRDDKMMANCDRLHGEIARQMLSLTKSVDALQRRKWWDTSVSAATGLLGGAAAAILAVWWFVKNAVAGG